MGSCKVLCECWERDPGPLQERRVLLAAEPLRPQNSFFFNVVSLLGEGKGVRREKRDRDRQRSVHLLREMVEREPQNSS